jgi:TNF receptor-associated protein 1
MISGRIITNSRRLPSVRCHGVLSTGSTVSTFGRSISSKTNEMLLSGNNSQRTRVVPMTSVVNVHSKQSYVSSNSYYMRYLSVTPENDSSDGTSRTEKPGTVEADVIENEKPKEKVEAVEAELVDDNTDKTKDGELFQDEKTADESSTVTVDAPPLPPPKPVIPPGEKMEFQAETRQLLDIVTHSLYTDKEVFLRELVSNASDSLEKLRHLQATNQVPTHPVGSDVPLEIRIDLDEVASSITISDTGIGMTKEELISNLGTIARSGSKSFVQEMKQSEGGEMDTSRGSIIGKFGVGFYSSFMVGHKVEVRSKSAMQPEEISKVWVSDGSGSYEISDLPEGIRQDRGSSIIIYLKEEDWDFVNEKKIETILKKYSNFVNFPIYLNGKLVNTVKALWSQDPKEITEEQYSDFFKYVANATEDPLETYHFRADAPIDIKALLFIPRKHNEKIGMERLEPGVSLYSRKILIEAKSDQILPDWLRFVKGVVDSEDLPLSISREKPQDSALVAKLRKTLTRKIVTHIARMASKEKEKYMDEFYGEYSYFLKEGMCQDADAQHQLARLLRFETSRAQEKGVTDNRLISFDEYIARMRPEQTDIYYLIAPSRNAALNSPYLEAFEKAGVEVLLLYTPIDEYVMANLEKYEEKKLVSADKGNIDFSRIAKTKADGTEEKKDDPAEKIYKAHRELSKEEQLDFCAWFRKTLDKKIASISCTNRLTTSPAIITDSQSGAMRRMMRMVDTGDGKQEPVSLPKQQVQINPKHPIIVGLFDILETQPSLARVLAEQIFDNCLVAAGLLDDGRTMLPRINDILVCVVNGERDRRGLTSGTNSATDGESNENSTTNSADPSTETLASKENQGEVDDPFDELRSAESKNKEESESSADVIEAEFTERADGVKSDDKKEIKQ